jgi:hypothetical protein
MNFFETNDICESSELFKTIKNLEPEKQITLMESNCRFQNLPFQFWRYDVPRQAGLPKKLTNMTGEHFLKVMFLIHNTNFCINKMTAVIFFFFIISNTYL